MTCQRTQGYNENANGLYLALKMKGHGGIDETCGYGSEITSPLDGYVYSVFDDKYPASDGYWAIYMICDYKGQVGELCIGHVSKMNVSIGQYVKKGDLIAWEGNKGLVYENGVKITLEMQKNGDKRGSHRHWQWRPLQKSLSFNGKVPALIDFSGKIYRDNQDYCYLVPNYNNGYRGLSPDIALILNDYTEWKIENAVVKNIETVSSNDDIIMKTFIAILTSYLQVLKNILRIKK